MQVVVVLQSLGDRQILDDFGWAEYEDDGSGFDTLATFADIRRSIVQFEEEDSWKL